MHLCKPAIVKINVRITATAVGLVTDVVQVPAVVHMSCLLEACLEGGARLLFVYIHAEHIYLLRKRER